MEHVLQVTHDCYSIDQQSRQNTKTSRRNWIQSRLIGSQIELFRSGHVGSISSLPICHSIKPFLETHTAVGDLLLNRILTFAVPFSCSVRAEACCYRSKHTGRHDATACKSFRYPQERFRFHWMTSRRILHFFHGCG